MKTKRAFLVEPKKFEFKEVEIEPKADDLLVKVLVCGLCNWELNHWHGTIGEYPQSVGHEVAGEIIALGDEVEGFSVGDKITCLLDSLYGFSDYITLNYKNAVKLSPKIDPITALGEPVKCVVTVLKAAAPEPGDYGVVVGCGSMGLWCVQALKGNLLSGLIAVDTDDSKLKLAKEYGATHTINPKEQPMDKVIAEITNGHMADFVIEGTGVPEVLETCIPCIKSGARGRLILMSSHEAPSKNFDFRGAIARCIDLRVPHPGYSLNQADDLRRAANLINDGVIDLSKIITHKFSLEDIQKGFETLENKPADYMKGVIIP